MQRFEDQGDRPHEEEEEEARLGWSAPARSCQTLWAVVVRSLNAGCRGSKGKPRVPSLDCSASLKLHRHHLQGASRIAQWRVGPASQ